MTLKRLITVLGDSMYWDNPKLPIKENNSNPCNTLCRKITIENGISQGRVLIFFISSQLSTILKTLSHSAKYRLFDGDLNASLLTGDTKLAQFPLQKFEFME